MPDNQICSFAEPVGPRFKDWPRERKPWGLCVHTTGTDPWMRHYRSKVDPFRWVVDFYLNNMIGPTYVAGHGPATWPANPGEAGLVQLSYDSEETWHCGLKGWQRAAYFTGAWKLLSPANAVALWQKKWTGVKSPAHLYPSASPNTDYCLDANVRVLTEDLRWVPVGAVHVGDILIGFHEDLRPHNRFQLSPVTYTHNVVKPRVKIVTTHGELVCSADHMFVGTPTMHNGRGRWLRADELHPGSALRYTMRPWETDSSYDGGWLAGMLDGEGHWAKRGELTISQNVGVVLEHLTDVLSTKNISYRVRGRPQDRVRTISLLGVGTGLAHVGRFRPVRMLQHARSHVIGRRVYGKTTERPEVLSVTKLPPGEVVAIKTTTKTFIAEGFLSHNCGLELLPLDKPDENGRYFTPWQHGLVARLYKDLATRHDWPARPTRGRLVGHEDINLFSGEFGRANGGGGWDPGALRQRPQFSWDLVYQIIDGIV